MIRCLVILLFIVCSTILHAQSLTQSVKNHIMGMTVVSAKEMTNEIASNRIKLNRHFEQIKEKDQKLMVLELEWQQLAEEKF